MDTVSVIKENGTCCACGICAAVCPVQAITMELAANGETQPVIGSACIQCGKCLKVCAGNGDTNGQMPDEVIASLTVAAKDEKLRYNATSGGFVTALVSQLLQKDIYDGAFLVDSQNYAGIVQTTRIRKEDELSTTQKSRYIQVTHTEEVSHILANPSGKYILVGTPCYFRGFLKVLEQYGLDRENYLLIGLFCDKTMTAHVWEYFNRFFANQSLDKMEFRSKVKNGWPGDVALHCTDGTRVDVSRKERMDVKEYFMASACLCCMDKMNPYADFSVGDNYVSGEKGKLGSNSVVIRTQRAANLFEACKEAFEQTECSYSDILKSQKFEKREADISQNKEKRKKKLALGAAGEYDRIREEILTLRKRNANPIRRFMGKCKRILKR